MSATELPKLDPSIFRAYDVRGLVGETITSEGVHLIGRMFGTEIRARASQPTAAVGRDGRASSSAYLEALAQGLCESGVEVFNLGLVPTPLVHYGALTLKAGAAVVVTGSHNPPSYNGLKFALGNLPFAGEELNGLRERFADADFATGCGEEHYIDVIDEYVADVASHVKLARTLHVVVDCGNGAAGVLARRLYEALGCQTTVLFEDVDSRFPNHHPDPAVPDNLLDLREAVVRLGADAGIAFDGDGDRVGVVTETGEDVWADRLLALFATDILPRHREQAVVFDVKCGLTVRKAIAQCGGYPVLSPTGHTNIKQRVHANRAVLGGEFSGHFCFPDRWHSIDDAAYAGARFLELVSKSADGASALFTSIEKRPSTPEILLSVDERRKFEIVDRLTRCASFEGGCVDRTDGLRVDFHDGWGLARPSNTSPKLSLRFEAETPESLERIKGVFQRELERIEPHLASQTW